MQVENAQKVIEKLEMREKVIEKLASSDRITIVIERLIDGKMRITSNSSDGERAFAVDQELEVRYAKSDGRLPIARKATRPDDWTRRLCPTICMGRTLPVTPSMSLMTEPSVTVNPASHAAKRMRAYRARRRQGTGELGLHHPSG